MRAASRVHLRAIDTYYLKRLSDEEQETIGRVMRDIVEGIRSGG